MPWGHRYLPLNDGRWTSIEGISVPVRTGPRGNRWNFYQKFPTDAVLVLTKGSIMDPTLDQDFHSTILSGDESVPVSPQVQTDAQHVYPDNISEAQFSGVVSPATITPLGCASPDEESSLFFPEQPADQTQPLSPTATSILESDAPHLGPCTCPVGYQCQQRAAGELDCRPLVPEWAAWGERMDKDICISLLTASDTSSKRVATRPELMAVGKYLDEIISLSSLSSTRKTFIFGMIRDWALKMDESDVSEEDVVASKIIGQLDRFLAPASAPKREANDFIPWLEESLTKIFRRWRKGDFSSYQNRGLVVKTTCDPNGAELRKEYLLDKKWAHYRAANYYGEGELVNGQIWRTRLQMMRDGAHGPPIAGISGNIRQGAYSVVMGCHDLNKNRCYADIDRGEVVDYLGTALRDDEDPNDPNPTNLEDTNMKTRTFDRSKGPTDHTKMLMKSLETGTPVRLFRSFKLAEIVTNKPDLGYRYDGLYQVIGQTPLKQDRQIWSFRMKRIPGQSPLHGFRVGEPTTRPSKGKRPGYTRTGKGSDRQRQR